MKDFFNEIKEQEEWKEKVNSNMTQITMPIRMLFENGSVSFEINHNHVNMSLDLTPTVILNTIRIKRRHFSNSEQLQFIIESELKKLLLGGLGKRLG